MVRERTERNGNGDERIENMNSYALNMKIIFVLFLTGIVGLSGCKKRLFDYRNKYVGDYSITTTVGSLQGGVYTEEEFTYQGKVWYNGKEHEKGVLVIVYDEGPFGKAIATINRKGKVINKNHSGEFTDEDHFEISFQNDPNGSGTILKGTRI
jgi:hypothetical protein